MSRGRSVDYSRLSHLIGEPKEWLQQAVGIGPTSEQISSAIKAYIPQLNASRENKIKSLEELKTSPLLSGHNEAKRQIQIARVDLEKEFKEEISDTSRLDRLEALRGDERVKASDVCRSDLRLRIVAVVDETKTAIKACTSLSELAAFREDPNVGTNTDCQNQFKAKAEILVAAKETKIAGIDNLDELIALRTTPDVNARIDDSRLRIAVSSVREVLEERIEKVINEAKKELPKRIKTIEENKGTPEEKIKALKTLYNDTSMSAHRDRLGFGKTSRQVKIQGAINRLLRHTASSQPPRRASSQAPPASSQPPPQPRDNVVQQEVKSDGVRKTLRKLTPLQEYEIGVEKKMEGMSKKEKFSLLERESTKLRKEFRNTPRVLNLALDMIEILKHTVEDQPDEPPSSSPGSRR